MPMKISMFLFTLIISSTTASVNAGTVVNGNWSPTGCGDKPAAPTINDKDIDDFNKSVELVNAWQPKVKAYLDCLVKEANNDNSAISSSANREQSNLRDIVEKVRETVAAAEKKLDK
jgi:hypothetical protein